MNERVFTIEQKVYVWLAALTTASLLVADVVGVKLFRIPLGFDVPVPWSQTPISAVTHTCGMLTFPITFILTDLLNEYYGARAARRAVWIAFAMGGFVFVVLNISLAMPAWDVPFNVAPGAFEAVFGSAKVMYVASLTAYLIGNVCDIFVFGVIKRFTGGRFIWLRATGSTIISQFVDSFFVTWLAFSVGRRLIEGTGVPMPFGEVLATAATGYSLKFVLAIAATPLVYLGHLVLRRWLGLTPLPARPG
jgi:hypothetical protein